PDLIRVSGCAHLSYHHVASSIIDAMRWVLLWDIESAQRFVPDIYMGARRGARVDLLRGLLDAAGVVEARGTLRVSASSGRLARGVPHSSARWAAGARCDGARRAPRMCAPSTTPNRRSS